MNDFTVDSEFVALCPPLSKDERSQLEANVVEHGCRDPLVVWDRESILLDGHNRLGICRTHKIEFETVRVSLEDRDAAKAWIITNQLGRRNLTPEALSILRGRLYEARKGTHGGGRSEASAHNEHLNIRAAIAAETNVSSATIERDAAFARAIDLLTEELGDDVRDKVLSRDARISKKDVLGLSKLDHDDRAVAGRLLLNGEARRLSDAMRTIRQSKSVPLDSPSSGEIHRVIHGDMIEVCESFEPGSFDAIITDPPYPREFLGCYRDLAVAAARVLREGGSLVAMAGQSYLPDVIQSMAEEGLRYHWTLAYLTPGGQAVQVWQRKVNTFWKPLLWFVKGTYDGPWIGDVLRSKTNDNDKRFHEWGQSESGMVDIVEKVSRPGDLVLDPFSGAGTTGVACVRRGRRYVGVELDEEKFRLSCQRLAAEKAGSTLEASINGQSALFGEVAQ